jgi:hypothetical protein
MLDLSCALNSRDHSLLIEAESQIGFDLARILTRFFTKQYGANFDIAKVETRRKNSDSMFQLEILL